MHRLLGQMDMNEIEIRRVVSNLQMRAALITAISILFAGGVLFFMCGRSAVSFLSIMMLAITAIAGVSVIRYTILCRNNVLGGSISYLQSVLFGFRFFFLSGMVITLGVYLFLHFHPNFFVDFFDEVERQYQVVVESGVKLSLSYEELKQERELLLSLSAYSIAFNLWFTYLIFGSCSALLYSLFIARTKKTVD